MENVTVLLAFSAGFLAFISPCCLPLYPSFISYITGVSVNELKEQKETFFSKKVLLHTLFFSLGFSVVYYILGFSVSKLGAFFSAYQSYIKMFGGIFLVAMGLFLMGVIKPAFMFKEVRLHYRKKSSSYFSSFLVGFVFAAGWTPCIGPIFGAIIYASVLNPGQTFANITAYSLGFCIPFILMALFISKTKFILKYSSALMKFGGFVIVILGLMLYFDKMLYLNIWASTLQYFIESLFFD
ncbi:cytochrome c biogenesis protein CcdA [Siminovitchia sp. FSL H7-0308]|uniref:Cytochrome c-type biogenesis protein n=1 Tax=Siminovitchia thermophila TaxID=1245522 RepID=A0ABS2R4X4_9BACI|nr:cytochrome c biogenesis protein CcdA [Siminovitchia thermophila]MBM7714693.1 cytochrome c-type biogenesis protein [Siminovitchia thermophila]ONK24523.1 cytochrome C biogenesis protein [Bacillus sp. VT-16-64]